MPPGLKPRPIGEVFAGWRPALPPKDKSTDKVIKTVLSRTARPGPRLMQIRVSPPVGCHLNEQDAVRRGPRVSGGLRMGHLAVTVKFESGMHPGLVDVEAEEGVADDLVEVAHGEVEVIDVAEGWAG